METQRRLFWLDFIRVISSVLVVLQHGISPEWMRMGAETPASLTWRIMNLIFMIARMAVPLFFLSSGCLMLSKERTIKDIWTHSIPSVLLTYVAWMLIFGFKEALTIIQNGNATPRVITNAFIKQILFGGFHTWFIFALIGLYMITPLLCTFVRNRTYLSYFVLLSFLFSCVFPLVASLDPSERLKEALSSFHMEYVTGYILYYMLGALLAGLALTATYAKIACAISVAGSLAAYLISCIQSVSRGSAVQDPYATPSLLGVLFTGALFYLARYLRDPAADSVVRRIIRFLADTSMGVYLLHPLFQLAIIERFPGLSSLVGALLIYGISLAVCAFLYLNRFTRRVFLHS